jgi:hypothetical protein
MTADPTAAWLEQQQEFWSRLAAGQGGSVPPETLQRLADFGSQYASLTHEFWQRFAAGGSEGPADSAGLQALFLAAYQQALRPASLQLPDHGHHVAVLVRLQQATHAFGQLLVAIAADAAARLMAALATPSADRIVSVAGLHELWLESGEQAWAAAAPRADFVAAQQELLAALTEWRAVQMEALDALGRQFGLTGRAEQDELYQELQSLRRRVRELERALRDREAGSP